MWFAWDLRASGAVEPELKPRPWGFQIQYCLHSISPVPIGARGGGLLAKQMEKTVEM